MNQPGPDLTVPYPTARDRAYAIVVVLGYWRLIEQLTKLVDMPPGSWPTRLSDLFPKFKYDGISEHPQQRLERWFGVYADEIKILRTVRNQLAHAVNIDDMDLRGADFLARVILASLFNVPPSRVDESWATSKINAISRDSGL